MNLITCLRAALALMLVVMGLQQAQSQVVFEQSTTGIYTFTVPSSTLYHIETWGGGGRGGNRSNNNGGAGGAGGGAYSKSTLTLTAGTYTIKVGKGGTQVGGADGDSSYVKNGTLLVLAMGGLGVNPNNDSGSAGGQAANGIGTTKYSGGNGANGTTTYGGGGASSAGTGAAGNNGITSTGGAAVAGGGAGGNGRTGTDGVGLSGTGPGGAGGGAKKTTNGGGPIDGGNGAAGKVKITLACIPVSISTQASDLTVECDGTGNTAELNAWLAANGGAVAINGCGALTWSNNYTGLSDDCGATGSATVTFTVTDGNLNSASTTATFTIEDTTSPQAVCQDIILEFDAYGNATISADDVDNGSSDACSEVTLTVSQADFDCTNLGSNTVTLTVTDDCGNVSTCTATVTVVVPTAWRCHNGEKVIFCHVPPNYPAQNIQEICVSMDVETICDHLGHGDHFGPCDGTEEGFAMALGTTDPMTTNDGHETAVKTTETAQASVESKLTVQPNPAVTETHIQFETQRQSQVVLNVLNSVGEVVSTLHKGLLDAGKHTFDWNTANHVDGVYFIYLQKDGKAETCRLIIAK